MSVTQNHDKITLAKSPKLNPTNGSAQPHKTFFRSYLLPRLYIPAPFFLLETSPCIWYEALPRRVTVDEPSRVFGDRKLRILEYSD